MFHSPACLSISLSVCPSVCLPSFLFIHLSLSLSVCPSVRPSNHSSVCLPFICLSFQMFVATLTSVPSRTGAATTSASTCREPSGASATKDSRLVIFRAGAPLQREHIAGALQPLNTNLEICDQTLQPLLFKNDFKLVKFRAGAPLQRERMAGA